MTALPDNGSQEGHDGREVEGFPPLPPSPPVRVLICPEGLEGDQLSSLPLTARVPRLWDFQLYNQDNPRQIDRLISVTLVKGRNPDQNLSPELRNELMFTICSLWVILGLRQETLWLCALPGTNFLLNLPFIL